MRRRLAGVTGSAILLQTIGGAGGAGESSISLGTAYGGDGGNGGAAGAIRSPGGAYSASGFAVLAGIVRWRRRRRR